MKLEKKHWIIIGVVVAIILVWYFFLRKKKTESGFKFTSAPARINPVSTAFVSGGGKMCEKCKTCSTPCGCGSEYVRCPTGSDNLGIPPITH